MSGLLSIRRVPDGISAALGHLLVNFSSLHQAAAPHSELQFRSYRFWLWPESTVRLYSPTPWRLDASCWRILHEEMRSLESVCFMNKSLGAEQDGVDGPERNKEAARKQKQDKGKPQEPESLLEMIKSILQSVSTTMTLFCFSSYELIFRGFNKTLYPFLPTVLFPLSQFNLNSGLYFQFGVKQKSSLMVLDTLTRLSQQEVEVQYNSMALASPGIRLTPSASSALWRHQWRPLLITDKKTGALWSDTTEKPLNKWKYRIRCTLKHNNNKNLLYLSMLNPLGINDARKPKRQSGALRFTSEKSLTHDLKAMK